IRPDDTVLVFGPGPIGLLLAQVVKAQGATVIMAGITKDSDRLRLAKELGMGRIVDTLKEDLAEVVLGMTDGYGAERVFDCSGAVPAVNQGLPLTKKKGDFVQVGLFAEKKNAIDEESIIRRE
ncbi:zinc-binding dehydrogenase, partial [Escherichia coli]|nr:zinc-binding dehydrogenase [Escherichia coli]